VTSDSVGAIYFTGKIHCVTGKIHCAWNPRSGIVVGETLGALLGQPKKAGIEDTSPGRRPAISSKARPDDAPEPRLRAVHALGGPRKGSIRSQWPQTSGARHAKSVQMPKQFPRIGSMESETDRILAPGTCSLKIAKRSQFFVRRSNDIPPANRGQPTKRPAQHWTHNRRRQEKVATKCRPSWLTAETVIDALEDAADYAAFEMAVTSDYEARTAVERELVLRLASLLWRLRRATAIESGLFNIQAEHLLQFRRRRGPQKQDNPADNIWRLAFVSECSEQQHDETSARFENWSPLNSKTAFQPDDLTRSFVRLTNLPTYPLDRLSRYEATLWRQACQVLFTLRCLGART
jgi:hypothetical protein